ncbi:hypothetical protein [Salinivibrio proteolyticus]|uniref:hypothetical protein n=1 Tax=Salinivibrio proteolyticus TaxID=334715 RepID=UPI0010549586|nr:hypothetical protein [Salinivibrio proteolyticus]
MEYVEDDAGNLFADCDTTALSDLADVQSYEQNLVLQYNPQHAEALKKQHLKRLQVMLHNLKTLESEGDLEAVELLAELQAEYPELQNL